MENLLYSVERYINNYFNLRNAPNDPDRNYPPAFLELVENIEKFIERQEIEKNNPTPLSMSDAGTTVHFAADAKCSLSWQQAFAPELGIYKRAKFI